MRVCYTSVCTLNLCLYHACVRACVYVCINDNSGGYAEAVEEDGCTKEIAAP